MDLFKHKNKKYLIEMAPFDVEYIITYISSLFYLLFPCLIPMWIYIDRLKQIERNPQSLFTSVCKLFISNFDTTYTQTGFEIAQRFGSF
jgi:tyrosine-protein phosphatase YwqE